MPSISTPRLLANLAALATASAVHAQTKVMYVDDSAPGGGDGSSWGSAFADLSSALTSLQGSLLAVEIHIAEGTYYPDPARLSAQKRFEIHSNSLNSAVVLDVRGGLSLLGGFRGGTGPKADERNPDQFITVISGDLKGDDGPNFTNRDDNSDMFLDIKSRDPVQLDGIVFRGAKHRQWDLAGCVTVGNVQEQPYWQHAPEIVISRCTFTDNLALTSAVWADAGYLGTELLLRIIDTKFVNNGHLNSQEVDSGSCIVIGQRVWSTIERCTFENNVGEWYGAVRNYSYSQGLIQDCVFAGNTTVSGYGAAIETYFSQRNTISRCTFVGNRAISLWGGSIFASCDSFVDCIVRPYPGAGTDHMIIIDNPSSNGAATSFEHCDIAGGSSSIVLWDSGLLAWGADNIDADPQFVDLDGPDNNIDTWHDNDLRLTNGSPCIDAGRPISQRAGELDITGSPRFFDGNGDGVARLDIGAYEWPSSAACPADFDHSGFVDTDDFDAFIRAFEAGC